MAVFSAECSIACVGHRFCFAVVGQRGRIYRQICPLEQLGCGVKALGHPYRCLEMGEPGRGKTAFAVL